jgi:hypothetical protein
MLTRRAGFLIALIFGVVVTTNATAGVEMPKAVEAPPTVAGTVCPFCRTAFGSDDFCTRCGRLARLTSTAADHRFWGDAVYAEFARLGDIPKLEAQFSAEGLISELVTFGSGDRVEMSLGKKGVVIKGKVGGSAVRKEDSYKAEMSEKRDDGGRLIQRSVWSKRNGDPDVYSYRVVDYKYSTDGLLDRIAFATRAYLGSSDWEKRPAGWIRHSGGEIVMVREAGMLRAIETKVRVFKRSLRGEPELGEEKTMRETVVRSGGLVDAVVAAAPTGG